MSSNKKLGNDFEAELCGILFEHGFWVHNLAQNASGQPADIIAVRNGRAYLIDCKVCSDGKFDLRRVEENQDSAMKLWKECGNWNGLFALRLEDEIRMMGYEDIICFRGKWSLPALDGKMVRAHSVPLGKWMEHIA